MKTDRKPRSFSIVLVCQVIATLSWYPPAGLSAEDSILSQILSTIDKDARLEAYIPCYLEEYTDAVCIVADRVITEGGAGFHKRSLRIYDVKRGTPRKVFEYEQEEYSGILSLRWMDTATIMAIWATGSGTAVTVFRQVGRDIKLVLDVGTTFPPEAVDLDGDGVPEVVISDGEWIVERDGRRAFKPAKSWIYKFRKDKYVQVKVTTYKERLRPLRGP